MKFPASLIVLLSYSVTSFATSHLPTIDLGYVRQRATEHNTTSGLYIYRNVRYARPPLGELRFRKPQPPLREPAGTISDGSQYKTTVCPQALKLKANTNGYSEDCLVSGILLFRIRSCFIFVGSSLTSMPRMASNLVMTYPCSCGSMGAHIL